MRVCALTLAAVLPDVTNAETTAVFGEQRPIIEAVRSQDKSQVESLLAAGGDPDQADALARTPLHYASALGQPDIVALLLQSHAELNRADQNGYTPLMRAAQNGKAEVVRLLLASRSNADLRNDDGHTALDLAQQNGHQQVVQILSAPK